MVSATELQSGIYTYEEEDGLLTTEFHMYMAPSSDYCYTNNTPSAYTWN